MQNKVYQEINHFWGTYLSWLQSWAPWKTFSMKFGSLWTCKKRLQMLHKRHTAKVQKWSLGQTRFIWKSLIHYTASIQHQSIKDTQNRTLNQVPKMSQYIINSQFLCGHTASIFQIMYSKLHHFIHWTSRYNIPCSPITSEVFQQLKGREKSRSEKNTITNWITSLK